MAHGKDIRTDKHASVNKCKFLGFLPSILEFSLPKAPLSGHNGELSSYKERDGTQKSKFTRAYFYLIPKELETRFHG